MSFHCTVCIKIKIKNGISNLVHGPFLKLFIIFSLFFRKMHFPYARTCYVYYEERLSEYIEPIINGVCKNLKRLSLPDDRYQPLPEHEEVNMGTTLFELYLVLKRFAVLGNFMQFLLQKDSCIQLSQPFF